VKSKLFGFVVCLVAIGIVDLSYGFAPSNLPIKMLGFILMASSGYLITKETLNH
jgi:hypothetical protein